MKKNKFKQNYQLKAKVQACLSKNFLRIPKSICGIKVLSNTNLNLPEKIILSEIISFQAQGRISTIGIRFILNEFNIPSGTASRAINTLLGRQSKRDKQLGIKRPKILVTKPIYWNNKKKSVRARELLINPNLIDNFINSHPNVLNKYLLSRHVPKKERMQKVNFVRKLIKNKVSQNEIHTFHGGRPASAYPSSNYSETDNKAFQSGISPFHNGIVQFHDGTHAFHSGRTSFHSGTNKTTYKIKYKNTNKNKSSSSSFPSSDSVEDDEDFSNSESNPKPRKKLNGSLHKANSKSHSSLNRASTKEMTVRQNKSISKSNREIPIGTSIETNFNNIIIKKLINVFPKLKRSATVKNTIVMLTRRYGHDAVQQGIEAVIARSDSIHAPIPYLMKSVANLSTKIAKGNKGKDPVLPFGMTQNQWNMLNWNQKRNDIKLMMINGRKKKGRYFIESNIRRYLLHETDHQDDSELPHNLIEKVYQGLSHHYEIHHDDPFGVEFGREFTNGSKKALKTRYYFFTMARLIAWAVKDYKLRLDDLVEESSTYFAKEEPKIEQFDSGDIVQCAIDKVVYRKFMKHLKASKLRVKKRDAIDKRRKQNKKFYLKKFHGKRLGLKEQDIMLAKWASQIPTKDTIFIYEHQFNDKLVKECTGDEIFNLMKKGIDKYRRQHGKLKESNKNK